jgi:hypothetical protein
LVKAVQELNNRVKELEENKWFVQQQVT